MCGYRWRLPAVDGKRVYFRARGNCSEGKVALKPGELVYKVDGPNSYETENY